MTPEDILPIYEREGRDWAAARKMSPWEAEVFAEALADQTGARVLDLGCGAGQPVAHWFARQGAKVTGVDGAAAMIALFREALPEARAIHADMRDLALGETFDVILGWHSVFHLSAADQRAMFPVFQRHAAPGAQLLLTTGPQAGTAIGRVGRARVFHASLSPDAYRDLFTAAGFDVQWFRPQDAALGGCSVWLAHYTGLH